MQQEGVTLPFIGLLMLMTGRGTVVTGRVQQGVINQGEDVKVVGLSDTMKVASTGVEMLKKSLDQ